MLADVHTATAIDFEERNAATTGEVWHLDELYASESLGSRALNLVAIECFEVVKVPELTGLTDAFAANESLMTVEP